MKTATDLRLATNGVTVSVAELPKTGEARGLECPNCGCRHLPAVYSKPREKGRVVRQRQCRNCGRKIVTVERVTHYGDGRNDDNAA